MLHKIKAVDQFKIKNVIFRFKSGVPLVPESNAVCEPSEKNVTMIKQLKFIFNIILSIPALIRNTRTVITVIIQMLFDSWSIAVYGIAAGTSSTLNINSGLV